MLFRRTAVSLKMTVVMLAITWTTFIVVMHGWMNLKWFEKKAEATPANAGAAPTKKFKIGFLPVTCHLTCPVTNFINTELGGDGIFEPVRFNGWPELKEAFLSGHTDATFILAPLAMKLREDGVDIKIVYLGHRDGSAVMVSKDSNIFETEDLRGKTVAVPNRFSNQRLLIFKALRDAGMTIDDIKLVEMPPPDMPVALATHSVDAISSGEPFMAQTELDGYGRVLWLTKDVWPDFISCVLAVKGDSIKNDRATVQALVDGIAKSGKWLDQSTDADANGLRDNREAASQFVAKFYYNQDPRLLAFALSKPPDRVKYTNLNLQRPNFEEIQELAIIAGVMNGTVSFDDYCDPSFVTDDSKVLPWYYTMPADRMRKDKEGKLVEPSQNPPGVPKGEQEQGG